MKLLITFSIIIFLSVNYTSFAQKSIEVIKFQDLEKLMQKGDGIYVFNFWASWCKPCVAEMPIFETLANDFRLNNVSVIFISLDFKRDLDAVKRFVEEHQIASQVFLIDEPDYNSWIDKVSPQWSGAIPATLIIKGQQKEFYEQSFDYQMLSEKIRHFF
ncbi:Thiol-disulfide oxidoreductase ResA [Emticicia aquatica]|uniref:Thiol-disulfide oxidoreductase ResA n=1 Tax=Emticicia aquatica TaxID=1681835 RepID=A0ABN8F012_9BACT|nr:TlpA disulfide reductase family protein [Emticicia aquatica]CAH0997031.1 Thiol-disulfide oxidoreductase ResA [Emticicia aquatica]